MFVILILIASSFHFLCIFWHPCLWFQYSCYHSMQGKYLVFQMWFDVTNIQDVQWIWADFAVCQSALLMAITTHNGSSLAGKIRYNSTAHSCDLCIYNCYFRINTIWLLVEGKCSNGEVSPIYCIHTMHAIICTA